MSTHNLSSDTGCPPTTTPLAAYVAVPIEKLTDRSLRHRIRLHFIDKMKEMGWKPADVVKLCKIDKGALSKFLAADGDAPLGLSNFARLTSLGFNANRAMHAEHPREKRNGSVSGRNGQRPGL